MVLRIFSCCFLLLILFRSGTALAEGFSLETIELPPGKAGKNLESVLKPQGVRILNEQGEPWCEVWIRQEIAKSQQPASPEAQYPSLHSGVLLGLMRFPREGSDYRGLPVKEGTYTMRYGVIPQDGNHVGAAPIVDFVLLIPLSEDAKAPDARLTSQELVELSRKASGTNHPTVISLAFPPDSVPETVLEKDDLDHWILSVPIRQKPDKELPLSIIIYGQAAG